MGNKIGIFDLTGIGKLRQGREAGPAEDRWCLRIMPLRELAGSTFAGRNSL